MLKKYHSKLKTLRVQCRTFELLMKLGELGMLKRKAKLRDLKIVIIKNYFLLGKYLNDEANEEDVSIPKIEIVEYESFYSNNKNNKSFLSAIVQQDENLGWGYNLNCKFNQSKKIRKLIFLFLWLTFNSSQVCSK